jgi:DNA-binding LytR/AlgR family response regulator
MVEAVGANGGDPGTSGKRRNLAIILATGFLAILVAITIGNAESLISQFAASGVHETPTHVWIWEVSSILAWLCVIPLIWWAVARVRPPRHNWPTVALVSIIGLPITSALHVGMMIGLRHLAYAAIGEAYRFEGGLTNPWLYEFRKDIATYLQFAGLAALAQWLLARYSSALRPADVPPLPPQAPDTFTLTDGARRFHVPVASIEHVTAAGNYVEISTEGRVMLHRTTLTNIEAELGPAFVRIHRSHLVNRKAIRQVETDRSGDFSVELASGRVLGGSRRYRDRLEAS